MQMQQVSEAAFLAASMTLQALRQEVLLYRQINEQARQKIEKLQERIKELEGRLEDITELEEADSSVKVDPVQTESE